MNPKTLIPYSKIAIKNDFFFFFALEKINYNGKIPYSYGRLRWRLLSAYRASLRPPLPAIGAIAPPKLSVCPEILINSTL